MGLLTYGSWEVILGHYLLFHPQAPVTSHFPRTKNTNVSLKNSQASYNHKKTGSGMMSSISLSKPGPGAHEVDAYKSSGAVPFNVSAKGT